MLNGSWAVQQQTPRPPQASLKVLAIPPLSHFSEDFCTKFSRRVNAARSIGRASDGFMKSAESLAQRPSLLRLTGLRLTPMRRVRLTENGDCLFEIPDEWIVQNPLWMELAPEVVEQARQRIAAAKKPTTPTNAST
jgi:hypothetical protein